MGKTMNKCEAAEFLGMSVSKLEKLVKEDNIPYKALDQKGRKILFQKGDLLKWAREKQIRRRL